MLYLVANHYTWLDLFDQTPSVSPAQDLDIQASSFKGAQFLGIASSQANRVQRFISFWILISTSLLWIAIYHNHIMLYLQTKQCRLVGFEQTPLESDILLDTLPLLWYLHGGLDVTMASKAHAYTAFCMIGGRWHRSVLRCKCVGGINPKRSKINWQSIW